MPDASSEVEGEELVDQEEEEEEEDVGDNTDVDEAEEEADRERFAAIQGQSLPKAAPEAASMAPPLKQSRGPRNPLPDDFLRVPGRSRGRMASAEQVRQDELLAQMLANEMLDQDMAERRGRQATRPARRAAPVDDEDDPDEIAEMTQKLKEGVSRASEAARTRFNELAKQFRKAASGVAERAQASSPGAASSRKTQSSGSHAPSSNSDARSEQLPSDFPPPPRPPAHPPNSGEDSTYANVE